MHFCQLMPIYERKSCKKIVRSCALCPCWAQLYFTSLEMASVWQSLIDVMFLFCLIVALSQQIEPITRQTILSRDYPYKPLAPCTRKYVPLCSCPVFSVIAGTIEHIYFKALLKIQGMNTKAHISLYMVP